MLWYRVPRALRVLVLAAAWFSYGVLLSNLNSLDDGSRTAEVIWGACLLGAGVTVVVDMAKPEWRRRLRRSRLATGLTPVVIFPYLGFGALSADSSASPYRVLLLWMFALSGVWVCVVVFRRTAHIKQLESAVGQRQEQQRPEPIAPPREDMSQAEKQWISHAETPMTQRLIATVVMTSVLAFLALLLADLDSVVYSDSRVAHLGWAALVAVPIGIVLTGTVFWDPRLRATNRTIDVILQYDRALRTGELPDQFDVDQWHRWLKRHRTSNATTLICAGFFLVVGGWSIVNHPPGYHWVVAMLLVALAIWQVRRWRYLCAMNTRLKTQVDRHTIRQSFG